MTLSTTDVTTFADDLSDGVLVLDERRGVVFANRAVERLLRYEPGELIGVRMDDLIVVPPPAAEAVDAGDTTSDWGEARCKDGTTLPVTFIQRPSTARSASSVAIVRSAARESEEMTRARLAAIVEASEDAIYSKTLDGTIVSWNPAAERLYGYAASEMIGHSISLLIPTERTGEMDIIMARLVAGAQIEQYETQRIRKDGSQVWISLSAAPTRDPLGRIVGASMIARDVTEQRRSKAALRESEERLRAVIDSAAEGILLQDRHDRTLLTNPSADRILGLNPDGTSGASAIDWRWQALREDGTPLPWHEHPISRTLQTGMSFSDVVVGVPAAGAEGRAGRAWQWLSINTGPVIAPGATAPHAVVVSFVDITDFKQTRADLDRQYQELDRRQLQLEAVLDSAREAMVLVSPDGSVAQANRGFYRLLNLAETDEDRVISLPLATLNDEITRCFGEGGLQTVVGALTTDDAVVTKPIEQVWPEPKDFDLSVATVRKADGGDLGRLLSFRDVTREREVARLKSDFVATVSHELRTPLTAMSGFVDIMLGGYAGELSARAHHYLSVVQTNNRRLTTIIDDLLDISRIEAGKTELFRAATDLATPISSVVSSFEPQLMSKRQSLLLDLPPRLPAVWADAPRIEQVLTNLLSNAHKYTPEGGAITIAVRPEETALRIEVIDTGIGLTVNEQARLFTKFFRSSDPRARGVTGTGLGLAITKSLVELHDGIMSVVSTPGRGSIFAFTLPYVPGVSEDGHDLHETRPAVLPTFVQYRQDLGIDPIDDRVVVAKRRDQPPPLLGIMPSTVVA